MVLITIVTGAYKTTNITGGPHIVPNMDVILVIKISAQIGRLGEYFRPTETSDMGISLLPMVSPATSAQETERVKVRWILSSSEKNAGC